MTSSCQGCQEAAGQEASCQPIHCISACAFDQEASCNECIMHEGILDIPYGVLYTPIVHFSTYMCTHDWMSPI